MIKNIWKLLTNSAWKLQTLGITMFAISVLTLIAIVLYIIRELYREAKEKGVEE